MACSPLKYNLSYSTHLEGIAGNTMSYKDSIVNFKFDTQSNGVNFTLSNQTNESLSILWDKSYFTLPNNNTYKALNEELLSIPEPLIIKYSNKTHIPPKSTISRFTTTASGIVSRDATMTLINSFRGNVNIYKEQKKEYIKESFWAHKITLKKKMNEITKNIDDNIETNLRKYIVDKNNLGLGFTINKGGKEYLYKFKIIIDTITVKRFSPDENGEYSYRIVKRILRK